VNGGPLAEAVALAERWREADADARAIRVQLADKVRAAHRAGTSEYAVVAATGLARTTVRDMLGKPR
jgi:hypothetical protein